MAREKFRLKDQKVISYGPCQTPTLWFCVQRHKEIQNFRATEYYYVSAKINILGKKNVRTVSVSKIMFNLHSFEKCADFLLKFSICIRISF